MLQRVWCSLLLSDTDGHTQATSLGFIMGRGGQVYQESREKTRCVPLPIVEPRPAPAPGRLCACDADKEATGTEPAPSEVSTARRAWSSTTDLLPMRPVKSGKTIERFWKWPKGWTEMTRRLFKNIYDNLIRKVRVCGR